MTSINLTRTEAEHRANLISDVHYSIQLDLSGGEQPDNKHFRSLTRITFTSGTGSTFLDLRADSLLRVELNGAALGDFTYDATTGIPLNDLSSGQHELLVEAEIPYSTTGQGLHRFFDPSDDQAYMYTQFETADAKRVFACFDQPDIKATYDVELTTPAEWTVVTNNEVSVAETEGVNKKKHSATVDYLLSTYLIAFCVGPWHVVRDEWRGTITEHPETAEALADNPLGKNLQTSGEMRVPLALYCRQSLAEYLDSDELFEVTKQGFDYYADKFGIGYPFYKYDQIFCPEYNMGAMENAGAVTIRDEYIFRSAASHYQYERRADTILHELAHMWFGDLVTMKWWDDLWLNESFATWSAAMSQAGATKYDTAWVTFNSKEKAWAYAQDQLSSTHPVFSDAGDIETVEANFDGITYAKGASVLKQLAAYVGLEEFFAGIRAHFAAHAWGNATFADLLGALEKASGRDLSDWSNQWLRTTGINTLTPVFEVTDGAYSSFAVEQSGAQPGAGETRTHRIAVGVYSFDGGALQRTKRVELDISGARTEVPGLVGVPAGDLVLVNDDDLVYGNMALDEGSLATAIGGAGSDGAGTGVPNIARITDPMARALVWSATWQMTRNAQMRARDFIGLVAGGAAEETELAVLEQILAQARSAAANYADPEWADEGWVQLREAFLAAARKTSGPAQLAFIRAFVGCVHSAESAEVLRALLGEAGDGAEAIPGLDVDQDLRWAIIIALTAAARATGDSSEQVEERIAAEEARDKSSSGAALALQARSSVPDEQTKQQVWHSLTVEAPQQSNLSLRHRNAGLVHVGHADLLQQFSADYAAHAVEWWKSLNSEMALRTLEGIYPTWDHSDATDAAITELVKAEDTPSGLRRVLSEGRDRVARAKAARAFDARAVDARAIDAAGK
ncbi:aminopeptidase N [Corynebacterium macclintockiae]|uniref:aminopeptidase N n=1 Tax=Corynebacterium macclintockiae TaxID=2913501 RepID=UPI00254B2C5D|nr:aminopeptidase N [Corynebacterium macclintockiae]MDK8890129.1 aminopeptidase N [Corynebacterium macclintockiae]